MTEKAFISLGSNIEPEKYLPLAIARLSSIGRLVGVSRVYQNPAVGTVSQPDFLNMAALVITDEAPETIRRRLREIEAMLGRTRDGDRFAPRTIDLDLCLCGSTVMTAPEIVLPHPQMTKQAFVAVPLAELEPDFAHPVDGRTLASIADELGGPAPFTPRPDVEAALAAPARQE